MGFGFNLIGFPLLLLATVGLIIYAIVSRSWQPLLAVAALWSLTILLFIVVAISAHFRTPIRLTRQDIIGEYRIDTDFYPGTNAQWQYDHYKFFITDNDSILFTVYNDKQTPYKTFKHKIKYSAGPPDLWKITTDSTYHVIKYQPTLYRGHDKFYYVFHSDYYGNMYFRKVKK